jgi:ubiquinone biosynthesis monooxygenase Coq7
MPRLDSLILRFDRALRVVSGVHRATRPSPAEGVADRGRDPVDRARAAALMRVNHAGEVCAQALYEGQALAARDSRNRESLEQAAREEEDHLAWSADRVHELGGHLSLLNPLWYAGSLAIGVAAGALGDRWSLAFLAETERQVEEHLTGHLAELSPEDRRSRAVIEAMRADEAGHRESALELGAADLPEAVKLGMRAMARVMTTIAHRI